MKEMRMRNAHELQTAGVASTRRSHNTTRFFDGESSASGSHYTPSEPPHYGEFDAFDGNATAGPSTSVADNVDFSLPRWTTVTACPSPPSSEPAEHGIHIQHLSPSPLLLLTGPLSLLVKYPFPSRAHVISIYLYLCPLSLLYGLFLPTVATHAQLLSLSTSTMTLTSGLRSE
ncbi:hypothetical protein B0H14DRAFT_3759912 [Mycena olivaceomarginata]|nr:hypothetical protein B0H14DRAFT_3759912 [Mycena olivaceomarginata]